MTTFQVNKKLVATAVVPGSGGTVFWWQVDLPGTTSAVTAYCAAGSTFTNPTCKIENANDRLIVTSFSG